MYPAITCPRPQHTIKPVLSGFTAQLSRLADTGALPIYWPIDDLQGGGIEKFHNSWIRHGAHSKPEACGPLKPVIGNELEL